MHAQAAVLLAAAGLASAAYAPQNVACPGDGLLRLSGTPAQGNQSLSPGESEYVQARKSQADQALLQWLSRSNLSSTVYGGDLSSNVSLPTIGIALSGGGNRAALYGAGALSAFDQRNSTSVEKGTGGLLQSATYLTGLSGGSWLLSSFVLNDVPEVYPMVLGDGTNSSSVGWNLQNDLFSPAGSANQTSQYQRGLFTDVAMKKAAGNWNVSIGDVWARALAYHFVPGTNPDNFFSNSSDHGASLTFSSATNLSSWANHSLPFPIIVGDVYSVNTRDQPIVDAWVPLQNVVYEFSPLEFGSYDPELSAFIPTKYMGSSVKSGTPETCVESFDNAGFVMGISSNVFHAYNVSDNIAWTNPVSPIYTLWTTINETFYNVQPEQQLDISSVPNPFQGLMNGTYEDSNETQLRMLDGGYNGEVDPVGPLLVKARNVDVIVVADATADSTEQQPTGASLAATEFRAEVLGDAVSVPPLPNSNITFVSQNLNTRPVFFGCKGTPAQLNGSQSASPYSMLVWLPNYDPTGVTNTSTGQLVYNASQATSFLDTSVDIVTRGLSNNSTEFATCLACAVMERTRGRQGVDRTSTCEQCFDRYCWDETDPNGRPPLAGSTSGGNSTTGGGGGGGNSTTGGGSGSGSGNGGSSSNGTVGSGGSNGGSSPSSGAGVIRGWSQSVLAALLAVGAAVLVI